jgi:hydrogenase-4 component F
MALGVVSVLLAAFGLWRRGDVKRFFSLSTVEQNGLAAVAIGLGGPLATYAALLQISLHTLTKAAVFQCVGHAAQLRGGQRFGDLAGLWPARPMLALTLGGAMLVLLGVPPSGLFAAKLAILGAAARDAPLVAAPLLVGLLVGGWALLSRLAVLCLGTAAAERGMPPSRLDLASAWVLLAVVLLVGLAAPPPAIAWMRSIAETMQ